MTTCWIKTGTSNWTYYFGNQIISEPKYYSMFADDLRIESVTLDGKFT